MLSLHGSRSGQHTPNKLRLSKPNRVRAGKSLLFLAPLPLQLPGVFTRGRGKEILTLSVLKWPHIPRGLRVILHDALERLSIDLYSRFDPRPYVRNTFNQIPIAPEDIEKTAITTPFGLFEFLFMPFGLRTASQTFQLYINRALGDLDFVYIYIDDILIASDSLEQHHKHLRAVFERLKKFHLRLNVDQRVFMVEELEFFRYLINTQGIKPT
ncbi:hypothetical protein TSAR_004166 [Trichomalopsis sarcophagae]|uniref:Reverse transcriptase domain-containing protein n=1 Tax=Trichomalopsis sarcophagae TaxID=543379 RepID=A0A232FBC7_9HYME|nr:hypothetical protein TSAR_004166 [Trichomalopsis sarcophagae]